jgi:RNA recognition motif-containing protein
MTIYVGNLSYQAGEQELTQLFSEYGEVTSVKIVKDMATGRPRGFAFVEMSDEDSADRAIEDLHETEFLQRTLIVNKARPKATIALQAVVAVAVSTAAAAVAAATTRGINNRILRSTRGQHYKCWPFFIA